MIAHDGRSWRIQWPRSAALVLILLNVVAYVMELIALRAGSDVVNELALVPKEVVQQGKVWQLFTTLLMHDPTRTGHLLFNMLWLWMVAPSLEMAWGSSRLYRTYLLAGLSGAVFTVLVGALAPLIPPLAGVWLSPHMGASGAVLGLVVAWGLLHADTNLNMLFLGQIKGRTFLVFVVILELIMALSYEPVSSTSHFGGMIGGAIFGLGLWRPANFQGAFRRLQLRWKKRQIERKLSKFEVIEGGRASSSTRPKREQEPSDWIH